MIAIFGHIQYWRWYPNFGGGALKSVWKVFLMGRAAPMPNISVAVERLPKGGKCQEDISLLVPLVLEKSPDAFILELGW